jgi:hypothetical protein
MKCRILSAGVTLLLGLTFGLFLTCTATASTSSLLWTHGIEAAASVPADVKCSIDGSSAYFTGNTKVDRSGKLLKEYKCTQFGHKFWAVAN